MVALGLSATRQSTWGRCNAVVFCLVAQGKDLKGPRWSGWAVRAWPAGMKDLYRIVEAERFCREMRRELWVVYGERADKQPERISAVDALARLKARELAALDQRRKRSHGGVVSQEEGDAAARWIEEEFRTQTAEWGG